MTKPHEFDTTGKDHSVGQHAEKQFERLAQQNGYEVTHATRNEDKFDHFDFHMRKGDEYHRVEVKAKKRFPILRGYNATGAFFLVEFKGVTGHDGWIHGKANFIALQERNGFYLVPRATLLEVADAKCTGKRVTNRDFMLYNLYGRAGRADMVTAILIEDIKKTGKYLFWKT